MNYDKYSELQALSIRSYQFSAAGRKRFTAVCMS